LELVFYRKGSGAEFGVSEMHPANMINCTTVNLNIAVGYNTIYLRPLVFAEKVGADSDIFSLKPKSRFFLPVNTFCTLLNL
jgi:hypothetical protein